MYGPVAVQYHAATWEHDALSEAKRARRYHTDVDHLKAMERAYGRAGQVRLVAVAVMALVAVALIVLI